jgi:hypothetical protein
MARVAITKGRFPITGTGSIPVHIEEYKALQDVLASYDEALASNTNFTLAALGAVIALSALMSVVDLVILFLIVPAVFYTLCWAHLRIVLYQNTIISCLQSELFPEIRTIASVNEDVSHLLQWEMYRKKSLRRQAWFWNLPILGPLFSLHLGSSLVLVAIPMFMSSQGAYQLRKLDYALLALNGIAIIYTAVQGWHIFRENIREKEH